MIRVVTGLCAILIAAGTARAQPFAVAGTGCGIGRADEQGLHRVYWELLDMTEICADAAASPDPVKLSFVLVYKGKRIVGEPVSLLVRIEAHGWLGPELPTFTLHIDDRRLELMSPNRRHELVYPCPPSEPCAFNGVVVVLTGEELRLISKSSVTSGQVFGKYFAVSVDGARAVRSLVALLDSVR